MTFVYRTDIFKTNFAEQLVKSYEINFLELIDIAKSLSIWLGYVSGLYSHAFSDNYLEITIMHDSCLHVSGHVQVATWDIFKQIIISRKIGELQNIIK